MIASPGADDCKPLQIQARKYLFRSHAPDLAAVPTQARIVHRPVGDPVSLLRNAMPVVAVDFKRHGRRPSTIEGSPPPQPTRDGPSRRPVQQRGTRTDGSKRLLFIENKRILRVHQ